MIEHDQRDNVGSYQHLPLCKGGQGRDDAEVESWGETLWAAMTILGIGVGVSVVMLALSLMVRGGA